MINILLLLAGLVCLAAFACFQHPRFGRPPSGARLDRIKRSRYYANGQFYNLAPKPMLAKGKNQAGILWDFLFKKPDQAAPAGIIPGRYTDLRQFGPQDNVLVWLGHSSYFVQMNGKTLLVDPVMGQIASPVAFVGQAFRGSRRYDLKDLPEANYVLITHDHWDHLEYETIRALKDSPATFVCGLGVGEHLEYWGVPLERILELDWNESHDLVEGLTLHSLPTHHFSGRTLRSNTSLWMAYVLESPTKRLYFGGDSGYEAHFAAAGKRFGGFDLAVLENGQYNVDWPHHHMQPEQTLQAAVDLHATTLLPVHSGKFVLARHAWDEPLRRLCALENPENLRLITPEIGEPVWLDDQTQTFSRWWESLE